MKKVILGLVFGVAAMSGVLVAYNESFPPGDEMCGRGEDYRGPLRKMLKDGRMKRHQKVDVIEQAPQTKQGCENCR